MKRALLPAGILILLVGLAGCVSIETTEERIEITPGASGTYGSGGTTVEVEPLTTDSSAPIRAGQEAIFLSRVRAELPPGNLLSGATDAQLLTVGEKACDAMAAGTPADRISVVSGETADAQGAYPDSAVIANAARTTICD